MISALSKPPNTRLAQDFERIPLNFHPASPQKKHNSKKNIGLRVKTSFTNTSRIIQVSIYPHLYKVQIITFQQGTHQIATTHDLATRFCTALQLEKMRRPRLSPYHSCASSRTCKRRLSCPGIQLKTCQTSRISTMLKNVKSELPTTEMWLVSCSLFPDKSFQV